MHRCRAHLENLTPRGSTFLSENSDPSPSVRGPATMKTDRTAQLPPFYTHVIGSLPRPQMVRDLLQNRGSMPADRFAEAMDDVVRFAIRLQEQAGMDVVSDGEWRRIQYVDEFLERIGGFPKIRKYDH